MEDLRSEIADLEEAQRERLVQAISTDWRTAGLSSQDVALCVYAEKLTREPATMSAADIETLRAEGLDDVAIHDAIQVIAYFNYVNRVADAVHVDLEPGMAPYPFEVGES